MYRRLSLIQGLSPPFDRLSTLRMLTLLARLWIIPVVNKSHLFGSSLVLVPLSLLHYVMFRN